MSSPLPVVLADLPLPERILSLLDGQVELHGWAALDGDEIAAVEGVYTYGHPRVDRRVMDRLPSLRVISNFGVGLDHIDLAEAAARKIPVGSTPGVLDGATADMGFALLMAAARRLAEGERYARGPEFTVYYPGHMLGREVHDATLGIVGLGRIGRQVARRASGFDMRLLYSDVAPNAEAEKKLGVARRSLDELLAEADYVMLTLPLSEQTRGLIGREQLKKMKPTGTLINIARGPIVDTEAITEALRERWIYAAALDVTDPEPLPRDHPLLALDNLTITPHLGSATEQTRDAMARRSVENLLAGLRGEKGIENS
jgi:glyoxylate reductase